MSAFSRRSIVRLVCISAIWVATGHAVTAQEGLALRGYDPVAYFTIGKPVPGSQEFELVWDERRFRFASAKHLDFFKADPLRYAPQFANYCTMSLTRGVLVEANPEHWLISDGKLYIFAGPNGPTLFQKAQTETLARAEQNRGMIRNR